MERAAATPRWFVPEDVDGFFGLFFSGLPDLLLIAALCLGLIIYLLGRIKPGGPWFTR